MRNFFYDISLKYKYFISLFIITLLSFLIFGVINAVFLRNDYLKQEEESLASRIEQSAALLGYRASMVKYGADIFAFQFADEGYLTEKKEAFTEFPGLYGRYSKEIESSLFSIRNIPSVHSVSLCIDSDIASLYDQDRIYYFGDFTDRKWYQSLAGTKESYVWSYGGIFEDPVNYPHATMLRKIYDRNDLSRVRGVIAIDVLLSTVEADLEAARTEDNGFVLLYDSDYRIISECNVPEMTVDDRNILLAHADSLNLGMTARVELGGKGYLVCALPVSQSDWREVLAVPYSAIREKMRKIYAAIPITLLLILPVIILVSWVMASLVTKPVSELISNMKKAEIGNFDIPIAKYRKDEIGELNKNFNVLLTKISFLLEEQYRLGEEVKSEQLKALQTQINPHFLYNTLDLINILAINNDTARINEAVRALSHFYRLSLNGGAEETTIANEFEHVREYVTIQNLRFDDNVKLITELPEELREVKIPKLCLQPLVENAIYHGILESESEKGTIRVSASAKNGYIYVEVHDDGAGMTEETAASILEKPKNDKGGYGVYNINERIRLAFGNDCGIWYESAVGKGTTASLRIKA
ncbi:MAG: histidine kinase [Lachnospiraceae bacterium]|nr:histidine kinase [Lachnospiraceae bacterium]